MIVRPDYCHWHSTADPQPQANRLWSSSSEFALSEPFCYEDFVSVDACFFADHACVTNRILSFLFFYFIFTEWCRYARKCKSLDLHFLMQLVISNHRIYAVFTCFMCRLYMCLLDKYAYTSEVCYKLLVDKLALNVLQVIVSYPPIYINTDGAN